jgi:hypothetical protein
MKRRDFCKSVSASGVAISLPGVLSASTPQKFFFRGKYEGEFIAGIRDGLITHYLPDNLWQVRGGTLYIKDYGFNNNTEYQWFSKGVAVVPDHVQMVYQFDDPNPLTGYFNTTYLRHESTKNGKLSILWREETESSIHENWTHENWTHDNDFIPEEDTIMMKTKRTPVC